MCFKNTRNCDSLFLYGTMTATCCETVVLLSDLCWPPDRNFIDVVFISNLDVAVVMFASSIPKTRGQMVLRTPFGHFHTHKELLDVLGTRPIKWRLCPDMTMVIDLDA